MVLGVLEQHKIGRRILRRAHRSRHWVRVWRLVAIALACGGGLAGNASAQTDEIQVYDAEINKPGQFSVQLHNNYTPIGRNHPGFPGGIVPEHALNGVAEWAYGATDWLELGLYLPLYSVTRDSRLLFNGAKLRTLFVVPHAQERNFFYGVNFELSFNAHHWEKTRYSGEIRPIVGLRIGAVDLIGNPILDTSFNGFRQLDFAPAERIAYNFSRTWAAAIEHYEDYGKVSGFEPVNRQDQTVFAVIDYKGEPNSVEFGIGHGFTAASDELVIKLMVTHSF